LIDVGLDFVRNEQQENVAALGRRRRIDRLETVGHRSHAVIILTVADNHAHARVAEIERLRTPLNAVSEHGNCLACQSSMSASLS
jgi:hypothetical protein